MSWYVEGGSMMKTLATSAVVAIAQLGVTYAAIFSIIYFTAGVFPDDWTGFVGFMTSAHMLRLDLLAVAVWTLVEYRRRAGAIS